MRTDPRDGVVAQTCPYCDHRIDAAIQADRFIEGPGEPPVAGDTAVCWYCAGVMVCEGQGAVRLPTAEERAVLLNLDGVVRAAGDVLLYRGLEKG